MAKILVVRLLSLHQSLSFILFSVNCATVKMGEVGFCACNNPCSDNQGDCDFNDQCQRGQRCRSKSCPASLGFDLNTDCCHIATLGDEDFCTIGEPCGVGEGHCNSGTQCRDGLSCGVDNCPDSLGFSSEINCCEPEGNPFINV